MAISRASNGEADWIVADPDIDFKEIPLLPPPATKAKLNLTKHRLYEKSGIVVLEYDL